MRRHTITLVAVVFEVMSTNRNEENSYKPQPHPEGPECHMHERVNSELSLWKGIRASHSRSSNPVSRKCSASCITCSRYIDFPVSLTDLRSLMTLSVHKL